MSESAAALLAIGGAYLGVLFLIAYVVDRMARRGKAGFIASPVVYTLSLAVYCTSWTFYGAVGSATRSGLEFITIYTGPTLVFMGWWLFLRKLVRISKTQGTTSIADFLSARYGKSAAVSALVTLVALVGITPYIALQLKAVATSFEVLSVAMAAPDPGSPEAWGATFAGEFGSGMDWMPTGIAADTGLWTAVLMAAFVILFGARNVRADESHPGVVAAIAFESIVKLVALMAVGLFVVFGILGGVDATFERTGWGTELASIVEIREGSGWRWTAITFLSAAAIICLPRQFQVTITENRDERHLATAAWMFPLYLLAISLFVVPIAIAGRSTLPETVNPDLFVLTVPLASGNEFLALVAFIGGLSAATSMVIVASIALSIMISHHLAGPLLARVPARLVDRDDGLRPTLLLIRRISIVVVMACGYAYYRAAAPSSGLASIGLISFAGVAQFVPALVGAVFWKGGTRTGALAGLSAGFVLWLLTLYLPSFDGVLARDAVSGALKALLLPGGPSADVDPLLFGLVVSLGLNVVLYVAVSCVSRQSSFEQLQSRLFVDVFRPARPELAPTAPVSANAADLHRLAARILGDDRADVLFGGRRPDAFERASDPRFIAHVERQLGYAVGAASARVMVARIVKGQAVNFETAIALLDETQALVSATRALETKSAELEKTAAELRAANAQLHAHDRLKDEFLSQVSHELRTPVTAIRSFAELLGDEETLESRRARRFVDVIRFESERMTRLLNDILDLSRMESGRVDLEWREVDVSTVVGEAVAVMEGFAHTKGVALRLAVPCEPMMAVTDPDRLKQVLVNLLSNAIKFSQGPDADVAVTVSPPPPQGMDWIEIRVADTGPGIPPDLRGSLFTKFSRGWRQAAREGEGSGLGLAISRHLMTALEGTVDLAATGPGGSVFRVSLPRAPQASPGRNADREAAE